MSDLYLRSDSYKGETSPDSDLRLRSATDKSPDPVSWDLDVWCDGQPLLAESDGTFDIWCDGAPVVPTTPGEVSSTVSLVVANAYHAHAAPNLTVTSAGATVQQHSFRFRDDDANESTATWAALKNVDINLLAGESRRIRFLLDATGDPDGTQFQLEYRHKPAAGVFAAWEKVL